MQALSFHGHILRIAAIQRLHVQDEAGVSSNDAFNHVLRVQLLGINMQEHPHTLVQAGAAQSVPGLPAAGPPALCAWLQTYAQRLREGVYTVSYSRARFGESVIHEDLDRPGTSWPENLAHCWM